MIDLTSAHALVRVRPASSWVLRDVCHTSLTYLSWCRNVQCGFKKGKKPVENTMLTSCPSSSHTAHSYTIATVAKRRVTYIMQYPRACWPYSLKSDCNKVFGA